MFEVIYKPEYSCAKSTKVAHLWLTLDDTKARKTHSMFETIMIRRNNVYNDVLAARERIASYLPTWTSHGIHTIIIHVPLGLVKQGSYYVDHVVSKLVNSCFQGSVLYTLKIVITHAETFPPSVLLQDATSKVRKVIGARILSTLPANVATPKYMASHIKSLFQKVPGCKVTVFGPQDLKKQGFGLICAVGDSARNKPYMVVVERKGKGDGQTVAIVGKGVTFDSGGLAIKHFKDMSDMKYDKIGAAYGVASLLYLMECKDLRDVTLVGAFPLAENAVSDNAVRPGDVIRSYNKKTVEITNPDAEGRLILADAFGYLSKYKPNLLVDVATLTGHASTINCWNYGYFYTNKERMRLDIEDISNQNGERMLSMPIWSDYDNVLQSNVADYSNSPIHCSDSFVATLFLKQFVPQGSSWVHIDLSHDFELGSMTPRGNCIRTIIDVVLYVLASKKK
jgi:leucyl aminopeptidase